MSRLSRWLENAYLETAMDRFRASLWRLRGATLGRGVKIGPRAMIRKPWNVRMGDYSIVEANAYFNVAKESGSVTVGERSFVGYGAELNSIQGIEVGDSVLIAPYCFISDHNHRYLKGKPIARQGCDAERVVIESDVWLGCGVVVLMGVRIGEGAVVGAGAVVTKDVGPYSVCVGAPARCIGLRTESGLMKAFAAARSGARRSTGPDWSEGEELPKEP